MNKYFGNPKNVASSARIESYFSQYKGSICENGPIREDKLLILTCRQIDSDIKLAQATLNNLKPHEMISRKNFEIDDNQHLHATERWKNKYVEDPIPNSLQTTLDSIIGDDVLELTGTGYTEDLFSEKHIKNKEKNKTTQNEETFDETTSLTSQFIEKIKKKTETSESFDISDYKSKQNDYYLPDFANRLSQLCKEFPCWTSVMNKYFGNPKNVASQAALNNLKPHEMISRKNFEKDDNQHLHATERWKNKYVEDPIPNSLQTTLDSIIGDDVLELTGTGYTEDLFSEKHIKNSYNKIDTNEVMNSNLNANESYLNCEANIDNQMSIESSDPLRDHSYCILETSGQELCINKSMENNQIPENNSNETKQNLIVDESREINKSDSFVNFTSNVTLSSSVNHEPLSNCKTLEKELPKRGTYVTPDPEIMIKLQKPQSNAKGKGVIRNSVNASLYANRAHILNSLFPCQNSVINCQGNLNDMFNKLMSEYTSMKELTTCQLCGFSNETKKCNIPIPSINIVQEDKYSTLEQALQEYFKDRSVYCHRCKKMSALLKKSSGSYLAIDTDDAYVLLQNSNMNITSDLREIPTSITLTENVYVLCGVIEFVPPVIPQGMGHYIAYCRKLNNTWKFYSSTLPNVTRIDHTYTVISTNAI
ncbi:hypothetical protein TSAR_005679 [Trichomalopsis sarcophagae]|uniref:USP domain-containing protein n=1 Tax=Trichomalopsis sarcophagae TaxID=543379 RepID=A0A232EKC6_9HYME|nr:hypothetical protein TSAR_005679 [Trichomalopsis sarcophagae]